MSVVQHNLNNNKLRHDQFVYTLLNCCVIYARHHFISNKQIDTKENDSSDMILQNVQDMILLVENCLLFNIQSHIIQAFTPVSNTAKTISDWIIYCYVIVETKLKSAALWNCAYCDSLQWKKYSEIKRKITNSAYVSSSMELYTDRILNLFLLRMYKYKQKEYYLTICSYLKSDLAQIVWKFVNPQIFLYTAVDTIISIV